MQWTACFHVGPLIQATLLNLWSKLMKLILTNLPLSKHNEVLGPCKCPFVCPMPPNFIEKKWHHPFPRSIFVWIVHEPHQNGKNNYIIQTTVAVMAYRKNYRERSQKQMCSCNFKTINRLQPKFSPSLLTWPVFDASLSSIPFVHCLGKRCLMLICGPSPRFLFWQGFVPTVCP